MAFLQLRLLGPPRIERDGRPLHFPRRRALALGVYLAVTAYTHSREALTAFFWPEVDPSAGRANLRRTLYALGRTVGGDFVLTEDDQVRLQRDHNLWIDLEQFRQLIAAYHRHDHPPDIVCDQCLPLLTQAADLYRDDFLAGFTLPDSPDFDAWQFFQGEQLRTEMALVLDLLLRGYTDRAQYMQAMVYAQRWLAMDPLHEPTHRQLMQLYAWTDQPAAAQHQYDLCSRLLADELAIEPDPETTALHRAILARQVTRPGSVATRTASPFQDDIRLVSVISLGLAGDPDEADLAGQVDALAGLASLVEKVVHPFGGRPDLLVGEDILILFGREQVHEDDAERALRAALTIRQVAMENDLAVRIGINTGMAYRGRRPGAAGDMTILGPVLNLATRLRHRAAPGQILVGHQTYLATRGLGVYTRQALSLPGLTEPVPAYALDRLHPQGRKVRGIEGLRAPLVGREGDLAALQATIQQLRTGAGGVVTLAGPAGVGKSRLVAELRASTTTLARTGDDSPLWLEGRGLEHAMQTSYGLFVDLLAGYFSSLQPTPGRPASLSGGSGEAVNETAIAQRVTTTLRQLQAQGRLSEAEVAEIGPLLGRVLGLHFDNDWDERLQTINPGQVRRRTRLALQRFLIALAQAQPLVLILEDLHWADPLSLELITALIDCVSTSPLLLLCLYRPELAQAEQSLAALAMKTCPARHLALHLEPLTRPQSRQLIAALLEIERLPAALRRQILDKAQGNPFFLEEWTRTLIERGVLYRADETWRARDEEAALPVPESLQSIILSRVDRLAAAPRELLQMAAILGRIFPARLLTAIAGDPPALKGALTDLQQQAFVHLERRLPESEYAFQHVLVQEAVYQDLPKARRTDLHRRAGQALEATYGDHLDPHLEALAHHYQRSDRTDKAITYLLRAGQKAQRNALNTEALAYFSRALQRVESAEPPKTGQRLAALRGLGEAHAALGDFEQGLAILQQAIALAGELGRQPLEIARLYLPLCHLLRWHGRFDDLFDFGRAGLALLEDEVESVEGVTLAAFTAVAAWLSGRRHQYREQMGRIMPILNRLPYGQHLLSAYGLVYWWYRDVKQVPAALVWTETLEAEARARNDLWTLGYLRAQSGYWLPDALGDLETILAKLQDSLAIAGQIGDQVLRGYVLTFLGFVQWEIGDLDLAEAMEREALAIHEAADACQMQVLNCKALGWVHLSRGAYPQAIAVCERGLAEAERLGYRVHGMRITLLCLGRAYCQQGRLRKAVAYYRRVAVEDEADAEGQVWIACALAGLAETLDDPVEMRRQFRAIRAARPASDPLPLRQWWLEAATPDPHFTLDDSPPFPTGPNLPTGWTWCDPFGDCAWTADQQGVTIQAAHFYRELWFNNHSAPRLLHSVCGDFAVQVDCAPSEANRPGMGGLLLWGNAQNYLRLAWGTHGPQEVNLLGCMDNQDLYLSRGRLPHAKRVTLRLERRGKTVRALCSPDGRTWFRVAEVAFPAAGPLQVGPFATGMQYSWVYPGRTPRGTAMRFSAFGLWRGPAS